MSHDKPANTKKHLKPWVAKSPVILRSRSLQRLLSFSKVAYGSVFVCYLSVVGRPAPGVLYNNASHFLNKEIEIISHRLTSECTYVRHQSWSTWWRVASSGTCNHFSYSSNTFIITFYFARNRNVAFGLIISCAFHYRIELKGFPNILGKHIQGEWVVEILAGRWTYIVQLSMTSVHSLTPK